MTNDKRRMTNGKWKMENKIRGLAARLLLYPPKEPFHLDRSADVCSFSDLLESVVSLDRKLDCILSYLDDLGASCYLRADWSRREVLHVDYDSNRNPSLG